MGVEGGRRDPDVVLRRFNWFVAHSTPVPPPQAKMMGVKALEACQILIDELQLQGQITAEQFLEEREQVSARFVLGSRMNPQAMQPKFTSAVDVCTGVGCSVRLCAAPTRSGAACRPSSRLRHAHRRRHVLPQAAL